MSDDKQATDAEARRRRLGSIGASLQGADRRKRGTDLLAPPAPGPGAPTPDNPAPPTLNPEPRPAAPVKTPQAAPVKQVDAVPASASPSVFSHTDEPAVHRVVMNLPLSASETLTKARGTVGRTYPEVVFAALEQAIAGGRLEDLVRDYEAPRPTGEYFQGQGRVSRGAVQQFQLRLSTENRNALDKLVTVFGAKSRTSLVAAALNGFRY